MDERKPSIPPSEFRLRSASEWTSADIDPPPAEFAKSDEPGALERQSRSGQNEPCRDDFSDGPSVAVYYRNEEEVRRIPHCTTRNGARSCRTTAPAGKASRQGREAVKTRVFPCLLPFCVVFVFACGPTASPSPADAIPFDTATRLDDFDFAASGDGRPGEWLVVDNDAGRGLAQIDTEPAENRLPFAIYRPFFGRDVYVSTRFMTIIC